MYQVRRQNTYTGYSQNGAASKSRDATQEVDLIFTFAGTRVKLSIREGHIKKREKCISSLHWTKQENGIPVRGKRDA